MSEPDITQQEQDGRADFDFLIGTWKMHHRQLQGWLQGSTSWDEFEGTLAARKILGGLGNMDEVTLERPSGRVQGMTVRLFDPRSRQWSLYWVDSKHPWNWHLPQIGAFKDGRGEFYAHEPIGGAHIFTRYIWLNQSETTCHWEQAFSTDAGRTWETNWIIDYERVA
jgi:Protein of unknown function (DUF1579)